MAFRRGEAERTGLSDAARDLRRQMWLVAGAAGVAFAAAAAGARGLLPRELGLISGGVGLLALGLAAAIGLQVRRQALADRERQGRRAMIVTLTATLGQQDDATLQRIAEGKGAPADVARMLLEARQRGGAERTAP